MRLYTLVKKKWEAELKARKGQTSSQKQALANPETNLTWEQQRPTQMDNKNEMQQEKINEAQLRTSQ